MIFKPFKFDLKTPYVGKKYWQKYTGMFFKHGGIGNLFNDEHW